MDDKTQGTEQQDQLSDMSRDELDAEISRLLGVYPVVRFLNEGDIEEDDSCLLYGGACVCMRGVCKDILRDGGSRTHRVLMGDQVHRASARYVNVDGKPGVLMCAQPVDAVASGMLSEELLYHDALSGAYNRRFYEDNLRNQHVFAGVAVLDMDDFKLVNDTLGPSCRRCRHQNGRERAQELHPVQRYARTLRRRRVRAGHPRHFR